LVFEEEYGGSRSVRGLLLAWIPERFVPLVDEAIPMSAGDAVRWAGDTQSDVGDDALRDLVGVVTAGWFSLPGGNRTGV